MKNPIRRKHAHTLWQTFLAVVCLATHVCAAELIPLGSLPGYEEFVPVGVSDDGSVVTGKLRLSGTSPLKVNAFRWTLADGMEELGLLPGARRTEVDENGRPSISGDGSTIVGSTLFGTERKAFRFTQETGLQLLDDSGVAFRASGVSADGEVIVGSTDVNDGAYRWTESSGLETIVEDGIATSVSADGNTIAGRVGNDEWIWTPTTGVTYLALENVDPFGSSILSDDSSTVFFAEFGNQPAYRWTATNGIESLGLATDLGEFEHGQFTGLNVDGSLAVGGLDDRNSFEGARGTIGFAWSERYGMENLQQALIDRHGMAEELDGWHLRAAMDISPDGRSIVGFAAGPNSDYDAWLIKLDQPFDALPLLTGDYNGDGTVEQGDLDLVLLQWGDDAASVTDTWTNDLPTGNVDQDELDKVLLGWGNTAAPIGAASVPEPAGVMLVVVALLAAWPAGFQFTRRGVSPILNNS